LDPVEKLVQKYFEDFLTMYVQEQEERVRTEQIRLKMLIKLRERLPKLYAELNRPIKMPKFPRVAK
jgi:hypothetical protein